MLVLGKWERLPFRSFGNGHFAFGSFAAFKGNGHARLVSHRWLSHAGPWILHYSPPPPPRP